VATSNQLRYTFHLNGEPTTAKLNEIFRRISTALRSTEGRHGVARIRAPLIIEVNEDGDAPISVVVTGTETPAPGSTPVIEDDLDEETSTPPLAGDFTVFYWRDEFLSGNADVAIPGLIGETNFRAMRSATSMDFTPTGSGNDNPGVWRMYMQSSGTSGDYAYIEHAAGPRPNEGCGRLTAIVRYIPNFGNANALQIGWSTNWAGGIGTHNGAYIEVTSGDSNWYAVTADGAAKTRTAGPAVSLSTWIKLDIIQDVDAGTWTFYADDSQFAQHGASDNPPYGFTIIKAGAYLEHTGSTEQAQFDIDLMENLVENLDRPS
jgi:hypothetical protein